MFKGEINLTDAQYEDFCKGASWRVYRWLDGEVMALARDEDGPYFWVRQNSDSRILSFDSKLEADVVYDNLPKSMKPGVQ